MNGSDIMVARRRAGISQAALAKALKFKAGRHSLTDVENGCIEVTEKWAAEVIKTISELSDKAS